MLDCQSLNHLLNEPAKLFLSLINVWFALVWIVNASRQVSQPPSKIAAHAKSESDHIWRSIKDFLKVQSVQIVFLGWGHTVFELFEFALLGFGLVSLQDVVSNAFFNLFRQQ